MKRERTEDRKKGKGVRKQNVYMERAQREGQYEGKEDVGEGRE